MKINEIVQLRASDYTGDYALGHLPLDIELKPLPGNDRFLWGTKQYRFGTEVVIVDSTKRNIIVGKLSLNPSNAINNALQVDTIVVARAYRGMGLAKSLYGIVLSILKVPLVSGDSQTPGGQRNWLSLASIPGVEIKGIIQISDSEFGPTKPPAKRDENYRQYVFAQQEAEQKIDQLMKLGGQYLGINSDKKHIFAFDVVPGTSHLTPAIQTTINKLYSDSWHDGTLLLATWAGR